MNLNILSVNCHKECYIQSTGDASHEIHILGDASYSPYKRILNFDVYKANKFWVLNHSLRFL